VAAVAVVATEIVVAVAAAVADIVARPTTNSVNTLLMSV
jgi:hypothetical protein